jgi:hypothetical protein
VTTLNLAVGASADDAFENPSATSINGTTALVDNTDEFAGWRWQNVTIASGSTVNSAILSVRITATTTDEPKLTLWGDDHDNAAQFAANIGDISGRTKTAATGTWNDTDVGSPINTFQQFGAATNGGAGTSLHAVVQEIIDRAGWASGNALAMFCSQTAPLDTTRDFGIDMYDLTSAAGALLDIDYTAGAGGGATIRNLASLGVGV